MLKEKIALVTGATRGTGRGIACMLGEAGATVYCTGRTSKNHKSPMQRPETIEETAAMVEKWGGIGIPLQVDHSRENEVVELMDKIKSAHGKLDILVNDIWGGDMHVEWGKPFWELDIEKGRAMIDTAIYTHLTTSKLAFPLMEKSDRGVIFEITDGDHYGYRGNLFYDMAKTNLIRIAYAMAWELRNKNIKTIAITPGFLRSEAMLEHFGVKEENWKDGIEKDPNFIASETPFFVGRCIARLCAEKDLERFNGKATSSWSIANTFDIKDINGTKPDWGKHFEQTYNVPFPKCDEAFYKTWDSAYLETVMSDWP